MRIAFAALALLLAVPFARATELGVNYNQNLGDIHNGLILRSEAKWARAFINVPRNYLEFGAADPSVITGVLDANIEQTPDRVSGNADVLAVVAVNKFIEIKGMLVRGQRVGTILSLKTDFKVGCVPDKPEACAGVPEVGTPEMKDLVDAILDRLTVGKLGAYVDILVVGNEPMFETNVGDAAKYGRFLQLLVSELVQLRAKEGWQFRIFAGALNKAAQLRADPLLTTIVDFVNTHPDVDGLDMHLHVGSLDEADADLDFVRNTKGVTKDIISTEFSLVNLWSAHASDPLGAWGASNGYPADMPLYAWLNELMKQAQAGQPIAPARFASYFRAQSWYPEGWFTSFFGILRKHGVMAATYGLQSTPAVPPIEYKPDSTLWIVNFVYNGSILGLGLDGFYVVSPLVYPEFQGIARGQWPR
jgi:hypothetical protein